MALVVTQHDYIIVGNIIGTQTLNHHPGWFLVSLLPEFINTGIKLEQQNNVYLKQHAGWEGHALLACMPRATVDNIKSTDVLLRLLHCDEREDTARTENRWVGAAIAVRLSPEPSLPIEEFQRQALIADGHRQFGAVAVRKERDPYRSSAGQEAGLAAEIHPILDKAAQFSGDDKINSPLPTENEEAKQEFENQLQNQLQQQHQLSQAPSTAPRATPS